MKFNIQKNFFKFILKIFRNYYITKHKSWGNKKLNNSLFFLSFDFETQRDINHIELLTTKLLKSNIKPYYAIPGELIKNNHKIFRKVCNKVTFINHGYKVHTKYCDIKKRNYSLFSYSKLNKQEIQIDIRKGHEMINNFCNQTSTIFRTPHFGEYAETGNMKYIYEIIKELGYKFSSSTPPIYSMIEAPIFSKNNIYELTSSSYVENPLQIIDSWSIFDSKLNFNDLNNELKKFKILLDSSNLFLNIYFDPSDIIDKKILFDRFSDLAKYQKRIEKLELR